jgi:hypothetical protein
MSARRPPSAATVRAVVAASAVLTLFHFTDNYVSIETYPPAGWQPEWFDVVVLVSWPLLTAFGVAGYLLYRRGQFAKAHACLLVYSYTGLGSAGHFLYGSPDEFTTRGLVSVFTDITVGSAVLGVTLWSILARRRQTAPAES